MELSEDEKELIIMALGNLVLNIVEVLENPETKYLGVDITNYPDLRDQTLALLERFEKTTEGEQPISRPNF